MSKHASDARSHNDALPICQLPVELLCLIFLQATVHFPHWIGYSSSLLPSLPGVSDSRRAVVLSHVCGLWRSVCLELPTIWETPVLRGHPHEMDEAMLARACDAPLAIFWNNKHSTIPPTITGLLRQTFGRIRYLYVSANEVPEDILMLEAPLLETAYLNCERSRGVIPIQFLAYAPNLRSLAFPCIEFPFHAPALSHQHLTRLTLGGPTGSVDPADVTNILDIISQAPRLISLSVASSRLRTHDWREWIEQKKPLLRERLPHMPLKEVILIGDFLCSVAILQHLQASSDVRLVLEIPRGGIADEPEMHALRSFLGPYMQTRQHSPRYAVFSQDQSALLTDMLSITLESSHERVLALLGGSYFDLYDKEDFHAHIWPFVITDLRWDRLVELELDIPHNSKHKLVNEILEMFAESRTLRTIRCLYTSSTTALISILGRDINDTELPRLPDDFLVFPSLERIVFRGTAVRHLLKELLLHNPTTAQSLILDSPTPLASLRGALGRRASQGSLLKELSFETSRLDGAEAACIQADAGLRACAQNITILGVTTESYVYVLCLDEHGDEN
jgi:hypothetical protein